MQDRAASCRHSTLRKAQGAGGVTGSTMNTECTGKSTNYTEIHVLRNIYSTWHTLLRVLPSYKSYRSYKSYFSAHSIGFALCALPATGNVLCFFLNRIAHGAWGETLLFPPWAPFSPVCYMGACGTQCTFFKLPRSPRRLRQRGGLNARCHSASQNIFCDVAAFAAIPSLGPCALGTHGLAPCVRVCTGIFCPCLWRLESPQGDSRPTCQRVLPAAEEQGTNSPARKKRELIVCEAISSQ